MVKIKEIHYQKDYSDNKQDRIIEYSSWEDYCRDVQIIDGTIHQLHYPAVPRQTPIRNFKFENENKITFEITMRINNMDVVCMSELIENL